MDGPYDKDDAAKDTDASSKEVSSAWHDARDDYEADLGGDRHDGDWGDCKGDGFGDGGHDTSI